MTSLSNVFLEVLCEDVKHFSLGVYIVTHRTMPDVLSMDTHSRTSRDEEALQDVASLLMTLRFYNDGRTGWPSNLQYDGGRISDKTQAFISNYLDSALKVDNPQTLECCTRIAECFEM
ncbi:hypothetical protein M514_06968 [Trichuris suis]|uniref:Uncharacterized protein n=1 Tax=Trichuris suis TaxID=68888 RepID=A0A085MWN5_9BILA|nr:hypothetical protein M514_06968 [Trichuris suis]